MDESGLFQKVMYHKLRRNAVLANFENEGTDIQMSAMHLEFKILPKSLLPMLNETSFYFGMSFILGFEENR